MYICVYVLVCLCVYLTNPAIYLSITRSWSNELRESI